MRHEMVAQVVYGDTVLMSQGFGTTYVNFTGTAPVTDDTIFRIGSNTKVFMTLSLHRLAELGIVGIDDPLEKYVPEVRRCVGYRCCVQPSPWVAWAWKSPQ